MGGQVIVGIFRIRDDAAIHKAVGVHVAADVVVVVWARIIVLRWVLCPPVAVLV